MVSKLKTEVIKRFEQNEKQPLLAESTFLDPRFKSYGFQNTQVFNNTKQAIINKGKQIILQNSSSQNNNSSVTTQPDNSIRNENSIWHEFDTGVEDVIQSLNLTASIIVEVDKYLQERPILRTQDPLKWWNDNKNVYPTLFILMKKRLCMQAT